MTAPSRLASIAVAVLLAAAAPAQPPDPDGNIPLPAPVLVRLLQHEPFEIDEVEATEGGIMDTAKLELDFEARQPELELDVKWKAAPAGGDGWNNSPRREIGAYAVQQLFLDPHDQVVPPVVLRCIPFDVYRPLDKDPQPTLPPHRCVLGTLSVWMHHVRMPDPVFDRARFERDPRYAYHFANVNLLGYLISHRDRRPSNFLLSTDPLNPQLYSVDNGIAFGGAMYNFLTWHFDRIAVANLPRTSIDRLRRVTPAQLAALGVLAELQPDGAGGLRAVPPGPNADPQAGVRRVGEGIQIGLTAAEIEAIAARRRELLAAIDGGEVGEF